MSIPLTTAEISDTRRFCGYPVSGSTALQDILLQGGSNTLTAVLASLTDDQIATLRTVYLANLYTLESAIPAASAGLDVARAAVYTRNPNELADRQSLFSQWRLNLCFFLGVPSGIGVGALVPAAFAV